MEPLPKCRVTIREIKKRKSLVILYVCLSKIQLGKLHMIIVFVHTKTKRLRLFSNYSGLKSVSEKLRFHDGLVWTVGLTVEIKLRFQITPAKRGR